MFEKKSEVTIPMMKRLPFYVFSADLLLITPSAFPAATRRFSPAAHFLGIQRLNQLGVSSFGNSSGVGVVGVGVALGVDSGVGVGLGVGGVGVGSREGEEGGDVGGVFEA